MPYSINDETVKITPDPERKKYLDEVTNRFISSTSENQLDRFSSMYNQIINPYVTKTYVDLSFIQSIYLGGILHMHADDEHIYRHVLDRLSIYSKRLSNHHASYFPELKITDEDILEFITKPEHALDIVMASPSTNVWNILKVYHKTTIEENTQALQAMAYDIVPMEYVVNIYPIKTSPTLAKLLKLRFIQGISDKYIKFGIISFPSHMLPPELYLYFDTFYVDDFNTWTNDEKSIAYEALTSFRLNRAKVFSRLLINNTDVESQLNKATSGELNTYVKELDNIYNGFTNFEFIPVKILYCEK